MAFDGYVGPLSRYLAGNWKTIGQVMAEEQGYKFVKITPKQGLLQRLFKPNPKKAYSMVRDDIRKSLSAAGIGEPDWDDSPDQEYVTDRPGWEGLTCFALQYAYARNPDMAPPTRALSIPDLDGDPAYQVEIRETGSPVPAILDTHYFLPGTDDYWLKVSTIFGEPIGIASIDMLDRALNTICSHCGYDRGQLAEMKLDQVDENGTFAEASLYGTSIYAKLVKEAIDRNLPLIHDY